MKNAFEVKLLSFLCDALQKPMPACSQGLYQSVVHHAHREGWVSASDFEDIFCETDSRLYRLDLAAFCKAVEIPLRSFFPRPRSNETQVFGQSGLPTADAAALLISLRRFGFSVDPQPLVDLVLPTLKAQVSLSEAELSVFWYRKERDRFAGLTVQADDQSPKDLTVAKFTTSTSHRVELCRNQDGNPWLLTVLPPKKARRKITQAA